MAFSYRRRVEFRDTDAAGIMHFSVFFPLMEEAEHAALRGLGLSVMSPIPGDSDESHDGDHLTWPRVSARCDYFSAARFEDELRIEVAVERIGKTSVTYRFDFFRGEEHLANGAVTAVCCRWSRGKPLQKLPIPSDIRAALSRLAADDSDAAAEKSVLP